MRPRASDSNRRGLDLPGNALMPGNSLKRGIRGADAAQPAMSLRSIHSVEEVSCPEVLGKVCSSLTAWVPEKIVASLGHDDAICQRLVQRLQQVEIVEPQGFEYAENQSPVLLVFRLPVAERPQNRQHQDREPRPIDGDQALQVCQARADLCNDLRARGLLWGYKSEPVTIGVTVLEEPRVQATNRPVGCEDDQGPVGLPKRYWRRLEIVEVKRQDDVIRINSSIESLVILDFLHRIEGLDSRIPVLILLRAIHGSEGLDNLTTMGDGVSDEQEPIHTRGLRCSIVVCERAKARVGAIAEHRSEAEAGIYYEGEPLGCALSELGEFVGSAESSIWCLDPVEYLDTENQESAGQASDQEVHE